jgi:dihydrofolate reductase
LSTSQDASTPHGGPIVTLIAAIAANRTIGLNNELPWHLPEDLKRFKALTLGHPVIMGRKTFDSIVARLGKPLPGRRNLVISRSQRSGLDGAEYYASLDAALAACRDVDEVFVIALPLAQRLQLTEVKADVAGDAFFPAFDRARFRETARTAGAGGEFPYDFATYERAT